MKKQYPVGTLVRFVCAPPRWKSESPRVPGRDNDGEDLLGQLAVTISLAETDGYDWGGLIDVYTLKGDSFTHYGDFLEQVCDC